jgi:hypothetical protein
MNDRLKGIYDRLERYGSMVTPNEVLLLLRDIHDRLTRIEGGNERLEETTKTRRKSNKVSGGDVSSS